MQKSGARWIAQLALPASLLASAGCARHGAPSLVLFGAYFPAWMLCGLVGILAAIGGRTALVASGLSEVLPFQLLVSASIGLIAALGAWLVWFGS